MLIKNCSLISNTIPNEIFHNYAAHIDQSVITEIGPSGMMETKYPNERTIDGHGQYLMPGLICAHTHFYGVFSRGMAIKGQPPNDFPSILKQLWWPLDQSLFADDIYYSSLACLVDAVKHGTTCIFDHHASPNSITGSLDIIEKAFLVSGIRGSVCYEVTDRGGESKCEEGIQENLRMISKTSINNYQDGMITSMFGLHAGLTLSEQTLNMVANLIPANKGFHVHVAEDLSDQEDSKTKSGQRVIERMHAKGITGKDSIFVHGVHLNSAELQIIKDTSTWLTHQPRSNMNNAVGMADIDAILSLGIPVCLGNDGFSFNMWDEWRTCYLVHKAWKRDPQAMAGDKVYGMGAINNALFASHFFGRKIGVIEPGAVADLILVDYDPITKLDTGNLPWHVLFGFRDSMVTMTMVNGRVLMEDRKLKTLDEKSVAAECRRLSTEVWKRYNQQSM
jgi:putative selenium metabolism protein SsnA